MELEGRVISYNLLISEIFLQCIKPIRALAPRVDVVIGRLGKVSAVLKLSTQTMTVGFSPLSHRLSQQLSTRVSRRTQVS